MNLPVFRRFLSVRYHFCMPSLGLSSLPFGYVYDPRMLAHECAYDKTMAEKPDRMKLIYERLQRDQLLKNAVKVEVRRATDEELELNHPSELLRELEVLSTEEDCEKYCKNKEILWLSPKSEEAARLAAGGGIELVKANVSGEIGNGFAIIRPPGHHAYAKTPLGYCVFNNVAIAAKYAVEELGLKRVAIVDFDYHPGNGTLYSVQDDDRIFLCSIHAYHHAAFWPFQTDMDYKTPGNQLFVPLNGTMNTEGDYVGIFNHLLLPILQETEPELILVSAGFDSGYFDVMMTIGQGVKAHGYGHMASLLAKFAPGKVLAFLEGGYFEQNYVESAAMLTRGLQGLSVPKLEHPKRISPALTETIWNNVIYHKQRFHSMAKKFDELQEQQKKWNLPPFRETTDVQLNIGAREMWEKVKKSDAVRTKEWFPELSPELDAICKEKIQEYIENYKWEETPELSRNELNEQLLWDERTRGLSFLQSARSCLPFVEDFEDFVSGKTDHWMICDHVLMRERNVSLPDRL